MTYVRVPWLSTGGERERRGRSNGFCGADGREGTERANCYLSDRNSRRKLILERFHRHITAEKRLFQLLTV